MKDQYQHYLELLKGLRLMDDDFFSEALDEKIEPVEYILPTILERNDIKFLPTPGASFQDTSFAFNTKAQPSAPSNWTSGL